MVPAAVRSRLRLVDCARDIAYIEAPAALIATARARGDTLERKRQLLPPPSRHKRKQRGGKTLKPNEVSGAYLAAVATALANPLQRLGDQLEPLCLPAAGNHQPTAVGELHSFDAALVEAVTGNPNGFASDRQWLLSASRRLRQLGAAHATAAENTRTPSEASAARQAGLAALEDEMFHHSGKYRAKSTAHKLECLIDDMVTLRRLPDVDAAEPLALMAGAPNVGKSSLVAALSTGRPEVNCYPFTTKGVSLGHILVGNDRANRLQLMDTPGLLDRPDHARNQIERQTLAALAHLQPLVVFVIDPDPSADMPLDRQLSLRQELLGRFGGHAGRRWLDVMSKSDLWQDGELGPGLACSLLQSDAMAAAVRVSMCELVDGSVVHKGGHGNQQQVEEVSDAEAIATALSQLASPSVLTSSSRRVHTELCGGLAELRRLIVERLTAI